MDFFLPSFVPGCYFNNLFIRNIVICKKTFSLLGFLLAIQDNSIEINFKNGFKCFDPGKLHSIAAFLFCLLIASCTDELSPASGVEKSTEVSPYIANVFDYQYGPGQHATLIPANEKGLNFIGEPFKLGKSFVSLGGWGGYITAGFDHAVLNKTGNDLAIYSQPSVASEPGIVYVMSDTNKDGIPNDGVWYELKGSEYNHPETIHGYEVTYFKPGSSGIITWKDNKGKEGMLVPKFESGSWWWTGYGSKTAITFSGEKLPDAYFNNSSDPTQEFWVTRSALFHFGYAECYDNEDYNSNLKANLLDISSAVDATGQPVKLASIHFIKIQSSIFQIAGWLNEISTEVSGAADISLLDPKSF